MMIDIKDIIGEISKDVTFVISTLKFDEFGIPTKENVDKTISVGIVETSYVQQFPDAEEKFKKNTISVWVDRNYLTSEEELIGASFFYAKNNYDITGMKSRNNLTTHIEYRAEKRVD